MVTVVYLLRHAAYENPHNLIHGRLPGFPLSKEGRVQAEALAQKLSDRPLTAVYSSHLLRARQTAGIIAKNHQLPVIIDDRLIDVRMPLQGKPISTMDKFKWDLYRPEIIKMGGERLIEVYERMNDFLTEKVIEHKGRQFVVVSHGDPIMSLKVKLSGDELNLRAVRQNYLSVGQGLKLTFDERNRFLNLMPIN